MKKIFALSVLVVLFGVAAVAPDRIKTASRVHEERMFATVDVLGKSFRSIASGDQLKIQVYSPVIDLKDDPKLWMVSGIVGVAVNVSNAAGAAAASNELFEPFSADVRSICKDAFESSCLKVDTLTISGTKLLANGLGSPSSSVPATGQTRQN
jgi:hypothetical protein